VQPGFRRVGLSGVVSYGIYNYIGSIADEMKIKRSNTLLIKSKQHIESNWLLSKLSTESPSDKAKSTYSQFRV
jgi:uncharacterized protein YifN (PemK superfamily)